MVDPLAEVVSFLQPTAPFSKLIIASAPWAVRRTATGRPYYFVVLEGGCHLMIDGRTHSDTIMLSEGDFALIPAARGFATSSLDRQPPREWDLVTTPVAPNVGGARVGDPNGAIDVRMLVGNCVLGSPDAALLVSLLPQWLHVRGERRLSTLVQLVSDESRTERPARDIVMARLLEVLLVEAFRSMASTASSPGLLRGLSDPKLVLALRSMHERPAEHRTASSRGSDVAFSLLRPLQPDRRRRTDAIPSGLAHGDREAAAPATRTSDRRNCGSDRVQLRQHLRRGVYAACWFAAWALFQA
jgi:hypothetical protein